MELPSPLPLPGALAQAPQPAPQSAPQPATERSAADAALRATATKFEAAFLTPMVEEMLRTAGPATFGAGHAEEIWRSVLAGAIAGEIAESGSTGIADSLARQMKAYGG